MVRRKYESDSHFLPASCSMANDNDNSTPPGDGGISPAKRRRLQQWFEQGSKVAAKGEFDYATEMYTQCVTGDPSNNIYVQSFLANLVKKYNNNKTGAKLAGMRTAGSKTAMKKCAMQKDWPAVIAAGLEVLKLNPWDAGALADIGNACEHLEHGECQLEYLKLAYEGDPKDVEVNRVYGRALGRMGRFDDAIACWHRVKLAKPTDEEAMRQIANLTVEKTIDRGGYETAETTRDVKVDKFKGRAVDMDDEDEERLSPHQRLERQIKKEPANVDLYIELADMYAREDNFEGAEEALTRALQASGGDVNIRERLEDAQLRRARNQLQIAEQKARAERTQKAVDLYNQMKVELNNKELQVYSNRCERYPANLGFKYELAVRLQKGKKYTEAIKLFQEARSDQKRKGQVFMSLGHCFAAIKQYKLAMTNFEQAVEHLSEREMDQKKEAMYLAGKVAVHLKDLDTADKHLNALAALDFGYKDISEWLDKVAKLREDGFDVVDE